MLARIASSENRKNVYRVYKQFHFGDGPMTAFPSLPGPLGPAIASEVPEIKESSKNYLEQQTSVHQGQE